MEYTINKLAKLAGVSTRALRYYDELGLLKPQRINTSGYRIYGQIQVDILQQILFYRRLGVPLEDIRKALACPSFNSVETLENHLASLLLQKEQLMQLIANLQKSILAAKGEIIMNDKEKFEGFKQKMLKDNETQYGEEIRKKYGEDTIDKSNKKLAGMTQEQYSQVEKLSVQLNEALKAAFLQGDPASDEAQQVCELHKKWLCFYWNEYSSKAHMGVAQMYVDDPRFTAYYDKIAVGCAEFLRDAVAVYCKKA